MISPAYKLVRRNLQAIVIAISACWLLLAGCHRAMHYSIDFLPLYVGSRCLLHECNPYDTAQLDAQYFQSGGLAKYRPQWRDTPPAYPPSAFLVLSPAALLRLPLALRVWSGLNAILLIGCVVFVRAMVPASSRWLVTILGSCYLISWSTLIHLVAGGQPAAFAISLLIIGTLLYLRGRYIPLATVLLTLSLAIKPQIGLMIVLYLVFKRIYWRQAILAIAGSIVLFLASGWLLSSRPVSARWYSDWRSNVAECMKAGEIDDPRPAAVQGHTFVNLQAITSVFVAEPKAYNTASYAIFLAAMAVWIIVALRRYSGPANHWLELAALSALTMLPVYHRDHDARLLILALPAISIILRQRRLLGSLIIAVTLLQIFLADIQRLIFHLHASGEDVSESKLHYLLSMRQESLEMVILAGCYLAAMVVIRAPGGDMPERERDLVELVGIEPTTSSLRTTRSPS